jgi:hypothetical protein
MFDSSRSESIRTSFPALSALAICERAKSVGQAIVDRSTLKKDFPKLKTLCRVFRGIRVPCAGFCSKEYVFLYPLYSFLPISFFDFADQCK